jgi:hypothetical protein
MVCIWTPHLLFSDNNTQPNGGLKHSSCKNKGNFPFFHAINSARESWHSSDLIGKFEDSRWNVIPVHAMKVRGSVVTAVLIFNLSARWMWVITFTPRPPRALGQNPGSHWAWGYMGSKAVPDDLEKRSLSPHGTSATIPRFLAQSLITTHTTLSRLVDVRTLNEATTASVYILCKDCRPRVCRAIISSI